MPAQANHTVWTAYLSGTTDIVPIGYCMIPNADASSYVIATATNRAAYSRTSAVSGIAITAGDSTNRHVEIQTVGPCPPSITGLTEGTASDLRVSDTGRLERANLVAGDIFAGKCDADGWAILNFSSAATTSDVQDDIAKSIGTSIDRVHGLTGAPFANTADGAAVAMVGAVPVADISGEIEFDKPVPPHWYDVKRYGAVGDGSSDDTAAINLAIAAANATSGTVYLPAGSYKVTTALTALNQGVRLLGVADHNAVNGSRIYSYLTGPDPLISLGDFGSANAFMRNGVESLTLIQVTDTASTFGTGGGFNYTTFQQQAHAGIQAIGASFWLVKGCIIEGFPIGIVMDGAEECVVENCKFLSTGSTGYSEGATHGVGIWLTVGATRNRGNTLPDATNGNRIRDCSFTGGEMNIWAEGGLLNAVLGCVFSMGVYGIVLGNVNCFSIRDCYWEGSTYTGNKIRREDLAISPSTAVNISILNCLLTGGVASLWIENTIYGLTMHGCALGSEPSSYAIRGCGNVVGFSLADNVLTSTTLGLADGSNQGNVGISHTEQGLVGGLGNYGVSINDMRSAVASLGIRQTSGAVPALRISALTDTALFEHNIPTPQKHDVRHYTVNPNSLLQCGPGSIAEVTHFAANGAAQELAAFEMPDFTHAIVTFTVMQWHSNQPTKFMRSVKKQSVYKYGGAITFIGTPDDLEPYEDTDGSFTAPTLDDDGGGNVVVTVASHPTQVSRAEVVINVVQLVA